MGAAGAVSPQAPSRTARAVRASAGAFALALMLPPAFAMGAVSHANVASSERALEQDVDAIAGDGPADRAEIRRQLIAESDLSSELGRLREAFDERWAGAFVEHVDGKTTLVVRLKGYSRDAGELQIAQPHQVDQTYETRIVEGVEFTEAEIRERIRPKLDAVKAAFPSVQGHYVDDATSEVVVLVSRPELFEGRSSAAARAEAERELSLRLSQIVGLPARVTLLPGPFR